VSWPVLAVAPKAQVARCHVPAYLPDSRWSAPPFGPSREAFAVGGGDDSPKQAAPKQTAPKQAAQREP